MAFLPASTMRSDGRRAGPRTGLHPAALAVLAALGAAPGAHGAETTLPPVTVQEAAERADGPVDGYRATRSATFTRTDTPLREVPASVTVVPAAVIRDQAMQSLADVIRYVPGATAHQGEGNRDQFILRGISTSADLYVDGVRDDAQVFRDLYNLERVEVLKGTAGMIFGRGGAGGVVNRVVKKPAFDPVREASITLGEAQQRRGTVDLGGRIGDAAAWRVNAMDERGASFRDGFDLRRHAVNPVLTLVPGTRTSLTLGYEHLRDLRTADRGVPSREGAPLAADPATFYGNAGQSEARSAVDAFNASLEHDFGGVALRNTFRVTRYDKFYQNVYADNAFSSAVDAAGNLKLAAYNNANRRTNTFNQTDLTTTLRTGGVEHTLLAGIELGHQDSAGRRTTGFFGAAANQTLATVPVAAPYAVATAFRPNGTDADNAVRADIAAVYLQDRIALGGAWKLLAGMRFDRFRTRFDDRRTTTTPVDLERTDQAWSPRLGLIWTPTASSAYYASYSYAFLPSGEQLSLAPNTADLAPETAKNLELGGRWDLAARLALSAVVFRLDRDQVRSPDALHPGYFVKTGRQRTDGVEVGIQGDVTRNWQVFGGYAYLHGRIESTTAAAAAGARLQLVPEHALSLWNRFSFGPRWGAGLGIVRQSAMFATLENRVRLPAFTRVDGALYYTFDGGGTRLALNLENILDATYFPTADGNNNISPGAPRTARLSVTTTF